LLVGLPASRARLHLDGCFRHCGSIQRFTGSEGPLPEEGLSGAQL